MSAASIIIKDNKFKLISIEFFITLSLFLLMRMC